MKKFNYYYDKATSISIMDEAKSIIYEEYKFNPDNIDSKSEEARIRNELNVKIWDKYNELSSQYSNIWEEFEHDLYEYYGVSDNPRRKKLFNIAKYEAGDDFENIYYIFGKWVEVIKD